MKNSARWTEWLLTLSLAIILVSLLIIAKIQSSFLDAPQQVAVARMIQVELSGAVLKPGLYSIEQGTPLKEILAKAKPDAFADLSSLDLAQPIRSDAKLEIRKLTELSIQIEGAVERSGLYTVPVGTRVCDLKKWVTLSSKADLKFLKSQRRLKNGENLSIPFDKKF